MPLDTSVGGQQGRPTSIRNRCAVRLPYSAATGRTDDSRLRTLRPTPHLLALTSAALGKILLDPCQASTAGASEPPTRATLGLESLERWMACQETSPKLGQISMTLPQLATSLGGRS
jgi:hypothetical protein